jgi:prophage antirepressor-like protein
MNNSIQSFNNKAFGTIRTMVGENGEPMFVGKDVAKALGYRNTREALQDHVDEEDKGVAKRDTLYFQRIQIWIG